MTINDDDGGDDDHDHESQYRVGNYTTSAAAVKSQGGVKIPQRPLEQNDDDCDVCDDGFDN